MLIIFPPVGIVMYMKDRFGPPKKIRFIICLLSALWFCLVIRSIAGIPQKKIRSEETLGNAIFAEPEVHHNRSVTLSKKDFVAAGSNGRVSMIKKALGNHITGDNAIVRFDDGTGIKFPGANIHVTAWYGEMDADGIITHPLGEVTISGDDETFTYNAYAPKRLLADELDELFPDEYRSDISSADVADSDDGRSYIVNFTIAVPGDRLTDTERNRIKTVFSGLLSDRRFTERLGKKKVSGASVRCIKQGSDDSLTDDPGSPETVESIMLTVFK